MRPPAAIPRSVGPYQIVAPLGRGGMAEVFHARLTRMGGFERDVAIKVMLPEYSSEQEFVEMLLDEARLAAAIHHGCIVQMLDVGRERDLFYLVMELVEGRDLRSVIRGGGKLRPEAALYVVGEVLRGLHAVHTATDRGGVPRRIVHRDVSPSNVMIDRAGAVKLGDFGIAHASSRLSRTRKNSVKGKLRYMAPEQVLGSGKVDHRADLYSLGVMLCELILGDVVGEMRRPTRFGPAFAWTPQLAARLPADVANLCRRALADDPNARYCDAAAFRREVTATLHCRAPGYGAEELARELFTLDEGFLSDAQTIADGPRTEANDTPREEPELYEDVKATTPMIQIPELQVAARPPQRPPQVVIPTPLVPRAVAVAQPYPTLPSSSEIRIKGGPLSQRVWMAAAAFVASVLLVGGVLSLGTSSSASPQVAALSQPQPIVRPLVTKPATGALTVEGPAGMSVLIGTTRYPPAPCRVELPPGDYEVKLRRSGHSRTAIRRVSVAAGSETSLRL